MQIKQVGEKTYYIENATNIGIYKIDDTHVYLIDTGSDSDAGKKILKIIESQGWKVKGIINTHSHADHIGGNKVIQNRTNCRIFAPNMEKSFIEFPILEPIFLYGSNPLPALKNKFLLAKESNVETLEEIPGLEYISLKGHSLDLIGIKTSDNVYFLGDAIFSEETINKYHVFYLYHVKEYLQTLDLLNTLNGDLYIPGHGEASEDISGQIQQNRMKIQEIADKIYHFCNTPHTFEEILKHIFEEYQLTMNPNQYVLIGSTIKSYLSDLQEENKLTYEFLDNQMIWLQTKENDLKKWKNKMKK